MTTIYFLLFCALSRALANCNCNETVLTPKVELPSGPVIGKIIVTEWGNKSLAFLGIPYAEPPLNSLRFAPPKPKSNWSDPLICQNYKPACPQNSTTSTTKQTSVDEDCLYLNVFQPVNCTSENKCAVIYYVHGGGNEFDSVWNFPQEVLVDNYCSRDVIFITSGYRLGLLGFFSTGTPEFPGNMAIKDVMLGLQWTRKNIELFGGDPTRVTLMGHSSAAALVSMMTLSPATEGLFDQAVTMSGTAFMPLTLNSAPSMRDKVLVEQLNCSANEEWNNNEFDKVVNCLRNIGWQELTQTYLHPTLEPDLSGMGSWPVYDGPNGLFPKPFEELAATRRPIPFMIGTVTREFPAYLSNTTMTSVYEACLEGTIMRGYQNQMAISAACAIHYAINIHHDKNSYKPDGINNKMGTAVVSVLNDVGIYMPTLEDAKNNVEKGGKTFLYEFEYSREGEENLTPYHSFDLTFVTGNHWSKINMTAEDQQIRDIYVDLFANFAKFGNPTPFTPFTKSKPKWFPLGPNGAANYYSIDLPAPNNKLSYHYEGNLFWGTIAPTADHLLSGGNERQQKNKTKRPRINNLMAVNQGGNKLADNNNTILTATLIGSACLAVGVLLALVGMKMKNRRNKRQSERKPLIQDSQQYQTFQQI